MTGDSPVTLEYGKPPRRRRRWGYALLACLTLAAAIASWHYRQPIQKWVNDACADWEFAREFDAVVGELCPDGATWLAPSGTTPGASRADALLMRLMMLTPAPVTFHWTPSSSVLFARTGQTGGQRWLAFACISKAGLHVFTFERDERTGTGYDSIVSTPTFYDRDDWNLSVHSVALTADGDADIHLVINGDDNRLLWSLAPAPPNTPKVNSHFYTRFSRTDLVASEVVPRTGWMFDEEPMPGRHWWPELRTVWLLDGAPRTTELPTVDQTWAIGFVGEQQIASISASEVRRIDLASGKSNRTHRLPVAKARILQLAAFSPDGQWAFLVGSRDPALLVNLSSGRVRPIVGIQGSPHLAFPDNDSLMISDDVSLRRIRLAGGAAEFIANPDGYGKVFAASGQLLARVSNRWIDLLDPTGGFQRPLGRAKDVEQLSLSPAGRWLAIRGQNGISLVDVESGKTVWEHDVNVDLFLARSRIKWSADGQIGATAGSRYVYVWSMTEPQWAARFPHGRNGRPVDVALSADGKRLAASGADSDTIAYWPDLRAALPGGK